MKRLAILTAAAGLILACGPAAQPQSSQGLPQQGLATSEQPKPGGMVRYYLRGDPPGGFEPHIPGGRRDARKILGGAIQHTVTWDNLPGEPCTIALRPALAEAWKFVDDMTIELALRKGVKWHNKPPVNGREMVAEDVVYSYKRMFDKGILQGEMRNVASIEAPDKYTVRVKLKEASPLTPSNWFAFREAVIVAKEAAGAQDDLSRPESVIGTGPFMLESYTPGVKAVLTKNPGYYKPGLPYLDGLELVIMRDDATRLAALRTGNLDFADEMTPAEKNQLSQGKPDIRWQGCESSAPLFIFMKSGEPPFNDVNVRRALSMSVDREAILKGIHKGEGFVAGTGPRFVEGVLKPEEYPAEIRKYLEYRPKEAKELLAKAGYPNGLTFPMSGTMDYGSPYSEILEVMPSMMKEGGFDVQLKLVSLAENDATNVQGKYDRSFAGKSGTGAYPAEKMLYGTHSSQHPNLNRSLIKDPEQDRLLDAMLRITDDKTRLEHAKRIQQRIVDQAFYIVTPTFYNFQALQPHLKGNLKFNESTIREVSWLLFEEAWVDK